jgi:hypothetical protein
MPLKYIMGQDELVCDFVLASKRAAGVIEPGDVYPKNARAIGITTMDDELIAGIVYYNYKPVAETIEMSVEALRGYRWLTPSTLSIMFRYPFIGCGCQMLISHTTTPYEHVMRMFAALNFSLIVIPRGGGRNKDAVIATLTVEDWIASKTCQRYKHHIVDDATAEAA